MKDLNFMSGILMNTKKILLLPLVIEFPAFTDGMSFYIGAMNPFEYFKNLALENCIEIHLSGSTIIKGKFLDLHHGILLDEQFKVLDLLIEKCPNLKVITYEDPKFLEDGSLVFKSIDSFNKIKTRAMKWME
jgi:uncharacterized protein